MKKLKYYLQKARRERFAIGQFNICTLEQAKGIVAAAEHLRSPVILGTSEGESKFLGLHEAVAIRNALRKRTGIPIFLNLDHGKSFEYLQKAIAAGYDMVHFDGSKLPIEDNTVISRKVTRFARWRGVVVEGEIGRIGTDASKVYQGQFETKEEDLADPEVARRYVSQSKVNLLAPGVGNFHGMDADMISPGIRLDRVKEIQEKAGVPLVLHGGSGTPEGDIRKAIELGVVKINVNTETRLAFSNALRKSLHESKNEITPYKYLPESIAAVQKVVEEKIRLFGAEGRV